MLFKFRCEFKCHQISSHYVCIHIVTTTVFKMSNCKWMRYHFPKKKIVDILLIFWKGKIQFHKKHKHIYQHLRWNVMQNDQSFKVISYNYNCYHFGFTYFNLHIAAHIWELRWQFVLEQHTLGPHIHSVYKAGKHKWEMMLLES